MTNNTSLPTTTPLAVTKNHVLADRIKQELISVILASPLNISFIPDDLERQMYDAIFTAIEDVIVEPSTWQKIKGFFNHLLSCFRSSSPSTETTNRINELCVPLESGIESGVESVEMEEKK
jgi:hypothetical protein